MNAIPKLVELSSLTSISFVLRPSVLVILGISTRQRDLLFDQLGNVQDQIASELCLAGNMIGWEVVIDVLLNGKADVN